MFELGYLNMELMVPESLEAACVSEAGIDF